MGFVEYNIQRVTALKIDVTFLWWFKKFNSLRYNQ